MVTLSTTIIQIGSDMFNRGFHYESSDVSKYQSRLDKMEYYYQRRKK